MSFPRWVSYHRIEAPPFLPKYVRELQFPMKKPETRIRSEFLDNRIGVPIRFCPVESIRVENGLPWV